MEAEIHPGEANGKDAMFMLLRDMSAADRPLAGLLEKINLLFIPVVNVDGDLRRSAYGRINQNGPQETGWRVNGRNLNLNRDFTKLDSAGDPQRRLGVQPLRTELLRRHSLHRRRHVSLRQLLLPQRQWLVTGEQRLDGPGHAQAGVPGAGKPQAHGP